MKRIISLLLILCLLFSVAGCGETARSKAPEYILNYSDSDVLSDQEYDNIEAFINTIYPDFLHVDLVTYDQGPEVFDKCMQIGIRGIPVIVDRLKFIETDPDTATDLWLNKYFYGLAAGANRYASFLALCSRGMTRSAKYFCAYDESSHPNVSGSATTYYCFLKYAKENIPKIINSDAEIHEKLKSLSVFGVYALPYVLAQIDAGNTEYEEYLIYIGLHLSTSEYMKIADKYHVTIDDVEEYDFGIENLEGQINELLVSGDRDGFDYKVWLSENEDDLNILFKYIDDFCAEYEAEQNK